DTLVKGAEGPLNDKQAHNLCIVIDSGRRLAHLVNDLLDYTKMKYDDIAFYKSAVDLRAAVEAVLKIHGHLLHGKSITLANQVPERFAAVYADGNRLMQILHNLIGNAVKFTNDGVIEVSAAIVGGKAEVSVSDTGIGIEPQMLDRIFAPFEQADSSA